LKRLKESAVSCFSIIVFMVYGNVDTAITTVHDYGAFWYIEKPLRPRAFRMLLERAVAQRRLLERSVRLERQLSSYGSLGSLIGSSAPMQEIFLLIQQVAPTRANVLITGESGTGKELVARAIHDLSPRRNGPFIALNCAALPESLIESELFGHEKGAFTDALSRRQGCFELAGQGTLFVFSKSAEYGASDRLASWMWTSASSRPPTNPWPSWFAAKPFARTCTSA
jgi:DNA-binding NtrC family response regulator